MISDLLTNSTNPLELLFSLHRFGIRPGLDRTLRLAEFAGNPHLTFPTIHVAGTNGKGSVTSMIASILVEAGYKTGLYTSPHLIRFNERIRIDGKQIPDEKIIEYTQKLLPETLSIGGTFFEITTVMAFKWFAECNADIAIIETGLGGRFDSTNIIKPLVSIITNIDFDHKEYLGDTLQEIAFEKAGIIKPNTPVIISDKNNITAPVFNKKANECDSKIIYISDYYRGEIINSNPGLSQTCNISTPDKSYKDLKLELAGNHQLNNLLTAIAALDLIKKDFHIEENQVRKGFHNIRKNTGIRARIELIRDTPPLIIDVAHNPDSFSRLFETIKQCGYMDKKWSLVFAVMEDKDIENILSIIKPDIEHLIITKPKIDRAASTGKISEIARNKGYQNIIVYPDVEEAVRFTIDSKNPTIIAGSFYLIGEALQVLSEYFEI
ncbi:MAG: Bifunctional folylpolyglutamate synthase/dihydrofolate synthase [Bacteroidota bacterium]|nr:Bifunctional folylpolyglutamate synthase/dihydrofolate synthase [Bacteroidota bacterium]